jgi:mono/diheme cytochrome c family protein
LWFGAGVVCAGAIVFGVNWTASAQAPARGATPSAVQPAADDRVARGRYIVEDVVVCGRCHSPVDGHGQRDTERWLMGGPVGIASTVPVDEWAILAPRLAGSPPGTDATVVRELMTGIGRTGQRLRQPMPQFRMTQADAEAVLAYLKSISGSTARPSADSR